MSRDSIVRSLGVEELEEWLSAQGVLPPADRELSVQERLSDGIAFCQLINKIKPGSVDEIKPRRCSGDAEENILRFLQACTTLGIKKIFRPADLAGERRDFSSVLVTLQLLYNIAVDLGMGLKLSRRSPPAQTENGVSPMGESTGGEEEEEDSGVLLHAIAVYAFSGTNEDELQFSKGDLVKVTNIVEGGWWEGVCNGNTGWFPGNFVEEIPKDGEGGAGGGEDEANYHRLVVLDILESEKAYVQDMENLLSTYLYPLKNTSVLSPKEADQLTGNLPELTKWQLSFLKQIDDCSKLPVSKQNMGTVFLKCAQEIESLYSMYCANHPKAVAVLTENSDKLSAFMESKGAASPGILTLTSNLSKPFRRLEKYPILLKELQRHLTEGHPDEKNVSTAIEAYKGVVTQTQEIRKRKEMEHEMLSNPVKGFNGSCLNELGECRCVIVANQALNAEEVDEVYFLIFPSSFVVLAVGPSLSGYELKHNYPLAAMVVKKVPHSDQWPWPVEIQHKHEVIHASLTSEADQRFLAEATMERMDGSRPSKISIPGAKALSHADSAQIFRTAYPSRSTRRSMVTIQRPHHWGFKSLRPANPLTTQQLIGLKERDKSPKSAKKFNYPNVKKKRASKHMEELLSLAGSMKVPVENRPGDTDILRVIEAYCAGGGRGGAVHSDHPITYITPRKSTSEKPTSRSHALSSLLPEDSDSKAARESFSKSTTLPATRSRGQSSPKHFNRPPNLALPGYPYRPPSPILFPGQGSSGDHHGQVQSASPASKSSNKRSLFRRRAESVDNARMRH